MQDVVFLGSKWEGELHLEVSGVRSTPPRDYGGNKSMTREIEVLGLSTRVERDTAHFEALLANMKSEETAKLTLRVMPHLTTAQRQQLQDDITAHFENECYYESDFIIMVDFEDVPAASVINDFFHVFSDRVEGFYRVMTTTCKTQYTKRW